VVISTALNVKVSVQLQVLWPHEHADLNAAYNIRDRYILLYGTEAGAVNHPIVTDSNVQLPYALVPAAVDNLCKKSNDLKAR